MCCPTTPGVSFRGLVYLVDGVTTAKAKPAAAALLSSPRGFCAASDICQSASHIGSFRGLAVGGDLEPKPAVRAWAKTCSAQLPC
jgi:hypothetical protein